MLKTVYGDDKRYKDTYRTQYEGVYFTGDEAKWDDDSYFWVIRCMDDVINVWGYQIGYHGSKRCFGESSIGCGKCSFVTGA